MHAKLIDIITEDVIRLFELDRDALYNLRLEYGLQYLDIRFEHDPAIGKAMSTYANFWNWWVELWAQRDRELMKYCKEQPWGISYRRYLPEYTVKVIRMADRWQWYQQYHKPERIKFYPNQLLVSSCMAELRRKQFSNF